jgi:AraC-like DNA-binding protein
MLGAPGHHEHVSGPQFHGPFATAAGVTERNIELPAEHQEELVGVVVAMPDVLTAGVCDTDVVVIDPADDPGQVDLVELGERGADVHGAGFHAPRIRCLAGPVLYGLDVDGGREGSCHIEAWVPPVPGIAEVFHARMTGWAYPPHCHDSWAVLIVDAGAIRYTLDRRSCAADGETVTVLPPEVIHDGCPAPGQRGFRKRELYLPMTFLPATLVGAAVDHTAIRDARLRRALAGLHDCLTSNDPPSEVGPAAWLADRGEQLRVEARLSFVAERIAAHLGHRPPRREPEPNLAGRLRDLLDERLAEPVTLGAAAAQLGRSVPHLVRSFTREFGVSPHAYLIGRRVDAARRALLQGARPADVAADLGFYDQAHFTRHFKRHVAVTPARFARGRGLCGRGPARS